MTDYVEAMPQGPDKSALNARLIGANNYCRREFHPHKQWLAEGRSGERYAQLNYCYNFHGTLECRLLPMFRKALDAVKAIRYVLNTYILFLQSFDWEAFSADHSAEAELPEEEPRAPWTAPYEFTLEPFTDMHHEMTVGWLVDNVLHTETINITRANAL
jgi:hypothetical protein